jgi:hypothetical protein
MFRRKNVIDEKTQAALSQIGREEKAAADEVSPIVGHRASVAQQKAMGFATLNPSYGLRRWNSAIVLFVANVRANTRCKFRVICGF